MNQTGLPVKPGNFSPPIFPKAGKFGRLSPLLSISTKYLSGFQLRHGCCNSQKPRLGFHSDSCGYLWNGSHCGIPEKGGLRSMKLSQNAVRVLLIGPKLRLNAELLNTLRGLPVELIFADEAAEAFHFMSSLRPDLAVVDSSLRDASPADFAFAVRGSRRLSEIPVLFADGNFISELDAFIKHKSAEILRRRELADLKSRHLQTLAIIRETADLFHSLVENDTPLAELPENLAEERIEFGMNMLRGLAGILDEEIKTIEELFANESAYFRDLSGDGELQELDMALTM
jgi:hypothetical protein